MNTTPSASLRVMAEHASSGIWGIGQVGPFRHGMVSHSRLKLPQLLSARFNSWIEMYETGTADVEEFNKCGIQLARDLKVFLGPTVYIEYQGERPDGGLAESQIID